MADDTGTPAAAEPQEPTYITLADLESFGEKMTDKLTSHFGRISKEQVNKSFEAGIDPEKINEQLSTKLFGGDVSGTIRDVVKNMQDEENTIKTKREEAVETEMEKFKDNPMFKETEEEVRTLAKEALNNGFPPGPAVELAVNKAKASFLERKDPEYNLGMSGNGSRTVRTKTKKLPSEFKEAAARDIGSGLFKDEAEYIENLSPAIKAKHGL